MYCFFEGLSADLIKCPYDSPFHYIYLQHCCSRDAPELQSLSNHKPMKDFTFKESPFIVLYCSQAVHGIIKFLINVKAVL